MKTPEQSQPPAAGEAAHITEAAVLAFFQSTIPGIAAMFPELDSVRACVSYDLTQIRVAGFTKDTQRCEDGYGATIAEACADLRKQLGTPESKAAKMREDAAKLIARAAKLTADTPATEGVQP